MTLKIYTTLSRQKEDFVPWQPGHRPFVKYWAHNGMLQAKTWGEQEGTYILSRKYPNCSAIHYLLINC